MTRSPLVLRDETGTRLALDPARWHGEPTAGEHRLLAHLTAPVLDVGCGPGRLLDALGRSGVMALGVDPAPAAVALARSKGCAVLQRSVFDRLPGERRWGAVLLLDGNIGIGGDPSRLLLRCRNLLRPAGTLVIEVEPPGTPSRSCRARLERDGNAGSWFPWAVVGHDVIASLASTVGFSLRELQRIEGRWIASLEHCTVMRDACA